MPRVAAKVDMNSGWPWDHSCLALTLGRTDLEAGLEQFLLPFRNADEFAQVPDETAPDDMADGLWHRGRPDLSREIAK